MMMTFPIRFVLFFPVFALAANLLLATSHVQARERSHPAVVGRDATADDEEGGRATEDFKGRPSDVTAGVGFLSGAGIVHSEVGFALIGLANKKIVHQGFAPDINNQVFAELQAGPIFFEGATTLFYSAHLRWDFQKDASWTLYAVAGLAGHVDTEGASDIPIFPRTGLGARLTLTEALALRAEISHELMALGLAFRL